MLGRRSGSGSGSPRQSAVLGVLIVVVALLTVSSAAVTTPLSRAADLTAIPAQPGTPLALPAPAPAVVTPVAPLIGGPAPSGPSACTDPLAPPFSGQIVVSATGAVYPAGAPVARHGSRLDLTGPVNGSILDLASNVTLDVSGCQLLYAPAPTSLYGNATAIEVRDASNVTVENAPITGNASQVGVWVNHSTSVTVSNVTADGEETGLGANESSDVNFSASAARNASATGIEFLHTVTAIAMDDNASGSAVGFEANGTQGVTFDSDTATGTAEGAALDSDSATTLRSSDLSGSSAQAVWMNDSGGDALYGNNLSGDALYGVYLDNSSGSVNLSENDLSGGHGYGVYVQAATGPLTIFGNDLANATDAGVDVEVTAGPVTILGNDLSANASGSSATGIEIDEVQASLNITDNDLSGGLYYGIQFDGFVYDPARIADNQLTNTTDGAIVSTGEFDSSLYITGNDLDVNQSAALDAIGLGFYSEIYGSLYLTDNQATGGFAHALDLEDYGYVAGSLVLRGNDFANATESSVEVDDGVGGNLVALDNQFSANGSTVGDQPTGLSLFGWEVSGAISIYENNFTGGLYYAVYINPYLPFEYPYSYSDSAGPSGSITIEGNDIANVTYQAIYVSYDGGNLYLENNDFAANASTVDQAIGLFVDDWTDTAYGWYPIAGSVVVTGNNFTGGLYGGLYFSYANPEEGATVGGSVTIEHNNFANVTGEVCVQLFSIGGNLVVQDNDLSENTSTVGYADGIGAPASITGSVSIESNNFTGDYEGVYAGNVYGLLDIADNDFGNVTFVDLELGEVTTVSIEDNYLGSTTESTGVIVEDSVTSLTLADNDLSGLGSAVTVDDANVFVATGNAIESTGYGLYVEQASSVTIANNDLSGAGGTGILIGSASYLSVTDNNLAGSNVAIDAHNIFGPAFVTGNNATGATIALNLSMGSSSSFFATVQDNNFSNAHEVDIRGSSLNLAGNDLLGTPWVNLTGDTVYAFYQNDFDTSGGSHFAVAGTTPATGSFDAPLPIGGNYWSGYTPTTVTNGIGSPPYRVGAYADDYPLAQPWYPYSITFVETGLSNGTVWAVTIAGVGTINAAAPDPVVFRPTNGQFTTYDYTVRAEGALTVEPPSGEFTANGASLTIAITFGAGFPVSFQTTGLPTGVALTVTLNGVRTTVTTPTEAMFTVTNGTYPYSATTSPGTFPLFGNVTVQGAGTSVTLVYNQSIEFEALGLPAGTTWYVNFTSTPEGAVVQNISTTDSSATVTDLPLGYYTIQWGSANKTYYLSGGSMQGFTLSEPGLQVEQRFTLYASQVNFSASGLGSVTWSVNITGVGNESQLFPGSILFSLSNASYAFVAYAAGYTADPASGTFDVSGVPVNETIVFSPTERPLTYPVTFATGPARAGAPWSIVATLTGDAPASAWVGEVWSTTSEGPTALLSLPNGTYRYTVEAAGQPVLVGSFQVDGQATQVVPTGSPGVVSGGPAGSLVEWPLALLLAAAAILGAILLGWRWTYRGRDPPTEESRNSPEER